METIRGLVGTIAGWFSDLQSLQALEKLVASPDKETVLREIKYRIEFINLSRASGNPNCKYCRGVGHGVDGRGDPWTCYDCKPDLKTYWRDK